jgi:glyoxylase-like metal-dependent hydrolase (beta-lactamase superfamily II)
MALELPVVDRWFEAVEVGEGVTRLTEPFVDPMIVSNVWHVRGVNADLLVDAGNGVGWLRPEIDALAEGRPVVAVATHGHFDHVGGLREFEDRRGHPEDREMTAAPYPLRLLRTDFPDGAEEEFAYYGYDVPECVISAVPAWGFDVAGWVAPGAQLTGLLVEGDSIDLGDRRFEVLHMPGHTAGSISLWEPERGILFTGDAIYVDARRSWDDQEAAVRSLRRLREVPARAVFAGHERPFDGDELREVIDEELAILGA